jgi:SAM-dependent methyltransferase
VQLGYTVPPEVMFKDYPYVSGTTRTLRDHFEGFAARITTRFSISPRELVVDIGSNDGTFLKGFRAAGTRTLGVDPATAIVRMANEAGIETVEGFFSEPLARGIAKSHGKAKSVTAAGVFFHIDDLHDVLRGVRALLSEDGVFIVQAVYLTDMIEENSFDNIYHEHLCYYCLWPLVRLFGMHGMEIFDVERSPIHGGSVLVYTQLKGINARPTGPAVSKVLEAERLAGYRTITKYRDFAARVEHNRDVLRQMVTSLRGQGKRVFAYGAPAKGNTLLNYVGLGTDLIECATEKNDLKCGYFTPGMHIPVVHEDTVKSDPPDYYLLLPWNFKEELLAKEQAFRQRGGKFIIPIPEPHIV